MQLSYENTLLFFLIYTLQLTFGYTIFKIFEIYLKILLGVIRGVRQSSFFYI